MTTWFCALPVPDASARLPGWPRGLREELAAAYVGIALSTLHNERRAKRFPEPVQLTPGGVVYSGRGR